MYKGLDNYLIKSLDEAMRDLMIGIYLEMKEVNKVLMFG